MDIIHTYHQSISSIDIIHGYNPSISSIDIIHGYDPWEPMGGTMGSRGGYHGCPMGRIPKPPGPQGTLGPLGPLGLIGPQGLMAPQGTQGSGVMAWTLAGAMGSHRVLRIKYALMQLHY